MAGTTQWPRQLPHLLHAQRPSNYASCCAVPTHLHCTALRGALADQSPNSEADNFRSAGTQAGRSLAAPLFYPRTEGMDVQHSGHHVTVSFSMSEGIASTRAIVPQGTSTLHFWGYFIYLSCIIYCFSFQRSQTSSFPQQDFPHGISIYTAFKRFKFVAGAAAFPSLLRRHLLLFSSCLQDLRLLAVKK